MSIADAIDAIERVRCQIHGTMADVVLAQIIEEHLLPSMAVADALREGAATIDANGTPSQVGPSASEMRLWADVLRQEWSQSEPVD